jgi:hypothetical protein
VVIAFTLAIGGLAGCNRDAVTSTSTGDGSTGAAGWQTLPASPLSARSDAAAIWTGSEVLVFGGHDPSAGAAAVGSASSPGTARTATTVAKGPSPSDPAPTVEPTAPPPTRQPGVLIDGAAYKPSTRTWRSLPAAPIPDGYSPGSVTAEGDRLTLLFGRGGVCMANDHSPDPAGAWYDAAADAWQTVPASPVPLVCGETAAWFQGKLWVYTMATGEVYDPATHTWSAAPPAAGTAITVTDLHAVGDRLVARVSSARGDDVSQVSLRWFDPVSQQWSDLPESPVPYGRTVVADGRLYNWDDSTGEAAELGLVTGTWKKLPDAPIATRYGDALVAIGKLLVVWGGNATPKRTQPPAGGQAIMPGPELRDGAVYDPATSAWSIVADAPIDGRRGMAATSAGDRLFVWGGGHIEKTDTGSRLVAFGDGAELTPRVDGSGTPSTTATPTTAPLPTFAPVRSAVG